MGQDFGTLGRLVVSVEAGIAQFERDLGKMEYQMQQFAGRIDSLASGASGAMKGIGLAMAGIGAGLSISAIEDKFHSITSSLAGLKEMSEKTGASVENLSAMAAVAKIAGVEMGGVELGMIKMAKAMAGADDTAKGAGHALEYLGLSAKQMRGMDTADAMQLVATKMEGVKDGASKVAIAMDIFGKSGAQLIPYLHDMVTTGDLVTKATDEQAEAAKRYEMDVKRLTMTKDQLYKTVTIAVLPAMDSLVKVMIDAGNATDGIRKAAKDLASDGTLESWGEKAGMAVAHVMDEFTLLKFLLVEISIPFERLGRNIETVGALAAIAVTGSLDEKKQAYAALEAENEKYFAGLDARKANNKLPTELWSDKYAARLKTDKGERASRFDAELDDVMYGADEKRDSYTSRAPTDGKNAKVDPYQAFIDRNKTKATGLSEGEIAKLQKESELIAGRSREQGFTPDTAAGAAAIAGVQKASETRLVDDYTRSLNKQVEAERNKLQLVGLSVHEQELLNIQNKADLDLNQKIEAETIKLGSVTVQTRDTMKAKSKEATDAIIADANARYAAERQWATGSKTAIDSYVEAITNAAAQSNKLFTNAFKGMEDALVNFVKTGKLDFKSLADQIITDLIRIQVQNSIMKPLVGTSSDPGILSQGLSALGKGVAGIFGFGGGKAAGGDVLPGQYYVVGENGPEILVPNTGGTVIPNGGTASSSQPSSPPVNINFNVQAIDAASFRSTLAANKNVIVGVVREAFTRRAITSPV